MDSGNSAKSDCNIVGLRHRARIASGAYGVVYRASSPHDDKSRPPHRYAVKRLLVSKMTSFCSCVRELDLVMSCQHPYVVRCFGLSRLDSVFHGGKPHSKSKRYKDDEFVQVYEYYDYTLADPRLLRRSGGGFLDLTLLALRLIIGLEFLHGREIVHRDLKPSNIMIDSMGRPRIGDFGQAQRVSLITSNMGQTLRYRSPELLARWPLTSYDNRASDIWALGCIIFELLHEGRSPFNSINDAAKSGHPISEAEILTDMNSHFGRPLPLPHSPDQVEDDVTSAPSTLAELTIIGMLNPNPRLRWTASKLVTHKVFDEASAIQRVRVICPPFSESLDNVSINSSSPFRQAVCREIRILSQYVPKAVPSVTCSYSSFFHALEIVDRLVVASPHQRESSSSAILLSTLYIMHKYLSEDHVREPLSFEAYKSLLQSAGWTSVPSETSNDFWLHLEEHILRSVEFIIYRKTPYEHLLVIKPSASEPEISRLLIAYTHLNSGVYHVGDIVAAASYLPLTASGLD